MHLVKKAVKLHKHLKQPESQQKPHSTPMNSVPHSQTQHVAPAALHHQQQTPSYQVPPPLPPKPHNSNSFPLPRGTATWVYDCKGGEAAMWRSYLHSFNDNNNRNPINIVYVYGGDMEYYPGSNDPFQTFFPQENQQAARLYKSCTGVSHVIAVIDGQMAEGEEYSPDLRKLSEEQLCQWADKTAAMYAQCPDIDGIQIDLEPFKGAFAAPLLCFLRRLSQNIQHIANTQGRTLSLSCFVPGHCATAELYEALGPVGYAIISGYDLHDGHAGDLHSPEQYAHALEHTLKKVVHNAKSCGGRFSVGIPAAASTHEFSQFVSKDGCTVRNGYPMVDYVNKAIDVIENVVKRDPQVAPLYLGVSLWGFTKAPGVPNNGKATFLPLHPFEQPETFHCLAQRL